MKSIPLPSAQSRRIPIVASEIGMPRFLLCILSLVFAGGCATTPGGSALESELFTEPPPAERVNTQVSSQSVELDDRTKLLSRLPQALASARFALEQGSTEQMRMAASQLAPFGASSRRWHGEDQARVARMQILLALGAHDESCLKAGVENLNDARTATLHGETQIMNLRPIIQRSRDFFSSVSPRISREFDRNLRAVLNCAAVFVGSTALTSEQLPAQAVVQIPSRTIAAPPSSSGRSGREHGTLVSNARELDQQWQAERKETTQLASNPDFGTGRDQLNSIEEAVQDGDRARAAEAYAAEMRAGRGPKFYQKQFEAFSKKEGEPLKFYDRINEFIAEARRSGAADAPAASSANLDAIVQALGQNPDAGAISRMRANLLQSRRERTQRLGRLTKDYPRTAIYQSS